MKGLQHGQVEDKVSRVCFSLDVNQCSTTIQSSSGSDSCVVHCWRLGGRKAWACGEASCSLGLTVRLSSRL